MLLRKYDKSPADTEDYDLDYSQWLHADETLTGAVASIVCLSAPGNTALSEVATDISFKVVRVKLAGGTLEESYKVTVVTSTSAGRIKESEFMVRVR